mgnify:FL=1
MIQELAQEIENIANAQVSGIHTALPGQIISFDAGTGLASVKPAGEFATENGNIDYPIITDAPIVAPYCQAAACGLAFPILPGDSCIIIISEVELNSWRSGAKSEGSLRFDLTNAMVIPGLLTCGVQPFARATASNSAIICAGETEIEVRASGVTIKGNVVIDGSIMASGDVKAAGISLNSHTHTSSDAGSQTSGPTK